MSEYKLKFENIVKLSNGMDESDLPCATATLAIDEIISNDKVNNITSLFLKDAEINMFFSGGCMVVQVDFPFTSNYEYYRSLDICKQYFDEITKFENNYLTLTVVPYKLLGEIVVLLCDLVYFTEIKKDNGFRLLMCFNNESTQVYNTDEIDYQDIVKQVDEELDEEENKLVEEINRVEQETKEIEKENNIYAQSVKEQYNNAQQIQNNKEENIEKNSYFRHTED